MKVKAKKNINENGQIIKIGSIFEIDDNRAKQLGDSVEKVEVKTKEVNKPPKDKMVKEGKVSK